MLYLPDNQHPITMKKVSFILILVFICINSFSQVSFDKHILTTTFTEGMECCAADINQDGFMDIISVGNDGAAWWENDGSQNFTMREIDFSATSVRSGRAADIDRDGDIDIVTAAVAPNEVAWYENDGNENFTKREVDYNFKGAHTICIADVNDDTFLDVLCSGFDLQGISAEVAWWENDGSQGWTKHLITDEFSRACYIDCADLDGDGDKDFVSCDEVTGRIFWWEDDLTEHQVDLSIYGIHTVIAKDIDYDGDKDLLGAACIGGTIARYINNGNGDFVKISMGAFPGALWLDAADFDMDGDRDLIGAPQGGSRLSWWECEGFNYTKYNFQDPFSQSFVSWPADIDNDGDTDVVAIGYMTNQLAWFENKLINVGVEEVTKMDDFNIYPNPAKDFINIHPGLCKANENYMIKVFSTSGELVICKTKSSKSSIDINSLQKGLYIIEISDSKSFVSKKLLKY